MYLGTRSHCFCQSRFYCSALIMVLSLFSLPLKSWAANSANDSGTAIVSKRETLQLIVGGRSPKIDSLVRAKLIPELSTRFDVVQDTAEYLLELGGEMEMSDDTLMTTKSFTLQTEEQNIHYRVVFTPPGGERALLFQELVITNDWLFGTFGTESVADKIMWKIEAEFPPPVAVASVEGSMVMLNYNVAVNSAIYFSRQLAVTVACGYLSYSRFPTPKGVSLQAGIRFWGK